MKVEKISISRGKKLSINYNSYDYHVSVSIDLEKETDITKAHQFGLSTLRILEQKEAEKIREEIE